MRVCLFRDRVLSSAAFRMVAPRIAALDAAISVKSLPVIPSSTSLVDHISNVQVRWGVVSRSPHILMVFVSWLGKVVVYGGDGPRRSWIAPVCTVFCSCS